MSFLMRFRGWDGSVMVLGTEREERTVSGVILMVRVLSSVK
jgi:hypothetical protein